MEPKQESSSSDFIDQNQNFRPTKMSQGATEITKDRPNLTDTILNEINHGYKKTQSLFCCPCICRVPKHLRERNESPYIPRLISIGPLHRDLQTPMQHIKKYYTGNLAFRVAEGNKRKQIEVLANCVDKMKECVDEAKKHYAEEVEVDDDEMAKMMVVDGCFILELLYASDERRLDGKSEAAGKETTNKGDSGKKPNGGDDSSTSRVDKQSFKDPILEILSTDAIVKQDLLLLENQIPFFVLEELFKLTVAEIPGKKIPGKKKLSSLTEYVVWYYDNIMSPGGENSGSTKTSCCSPSHCVLWIRGSTKEKEGQKKEPGKASDYYHILHLLHDHFLPNSSGAPHASSGPCPGTPHHQEKQQKKDFSELEVRASDLDYAGVKFVPGNGNNQFDVRFKEPKCVFWWFHRATFEIPVLCIEDLTEPFLRNIIAFEQCCPGVLCYFTSYAKFMDMLIDSEKDVRVLQKAKVIRNYLGSDEEVSVLFNNLCKDVVIGDDFHFDDQCQDAYKYSKYRWPKIMAYWNRTYFASPWAFKGFILAIIVFGIQVTTFIRSFLE